MLSEILIIGGNDLKKKDVSIRLVSKQSDGENKEETELLSEGTLEATDESYTISYEETEATGFEGSTTSLTAFGNEKVMMKRTGNVTSDLIVEIGRKQHCIYGTPYGEFSVGVTAKSIENKLSENGGSLSFHYIIDVNSCYLGDFEINIDVK